MNLEMAVPNFKSVLATILLLFLITFQKGCNLGVISQGALRVLFQCACALGNSTASGASQWVGSAIPWFHPAAY